MRFEEVDGNYYLKNVSVTDLDELYEHKNQRMMMIAMMSRAIAP